MSGCGQQRVFGARPGGHATEGGPVPPLPLTGAALLAGKAGPPMLEGAMRNATDVLSTLAGPAEPLFYAATLAFSTVALLLHNEPKDLADRSRAASRGAGPVGAWRVTRAVYAGRAVADPGLAGAVVLHAELLERRFSGSKRLWVLGCLAVMSACGAVRGLDAVSATPPDRLTVAFGVLSTAMWPLALLVTGQRQRRRFRRAMVLNRERADPPAAAGEESP